MADPIKRLHYFNHQFLEERDFTTEQHYHLDMRRRHNRLLHTWGIAEGLEVTFKQGEKEVAIERGTAIDGQGREIVLVERERTSLPSGTAGEPVYLTIHHEDELTDRSEETGAEGYTRCTEQPKIVASEDASDPADEINLFLARVDRNDDGFVTGVDPSQRRRAGAVGGDLAVTSLQLRVPEAAQSTWPRLSAQTHQANVAGSLGSSGSVRVDTGDANAGTRTPGLTFGAEATSQEGIASRRTAGRNRHGLDLYTGDVARLSIDRAGQVGIGTTGPKSTLDVRGGALIEGPLTVGAGGDTTLTTRRIDGKRADNDKADALYLNRGTGQPVEVGGADGDGKPSLLRVFGPVDARDRLNIGGNLSCSGDANAERGINARGLALGTDSSAPDYPWGYETVRVNDPNMNLRLQSTNSLLLHPGGGDWQVAVWPDGHVTLRGDLTIGEARNASIKVRHLYGKEIGGDKPEAMFLNYGVDAPVVVGGHEGKGPPLHAYGGLWVGGSATIAGNIGTQGRSPTAGLPPGWGGGVHTWDVYANATVAAGPSGGVTQAGLNSMGDMWANRDLTVGRNLHLSRPESVIKVRTFPLRVQNKGQDNPGEWSVGYAGEFAQVYSVFAVLQGYNMVVQDMSVGWHWVNVEVIPQNVWVRVDVFDTNGARGRAYVSESHPPHEVNNVAYVLVVVLGRTVS